MWTRSDGLLRWKESSRFRQVVTIFLANSETVLPGIFRPLLVNGFGTLYCAPCTVFIGHFFAEFLWSVSPRIAN